jgi:ribosomal protein L44E
VLRGNDVIPESRMATVDKLSQFSRKKKKAKTTKKIVLRVECVEINYRCKRMPAIKKCKHIELDGNEKRKGQVI